MKRPTEEDILKPTVIVCGRCGGDLHVIPFRKDLGKGRVSIETINICGKCTFQKEVRHARI